MTERFIGTSGWNYKHWKGILYPLKLSPRCWLDCYVEYFNTVELNVTFYRLVKETTFENWREETPDSFVFAVKGSRYISHVKKLKQAEAALDRLELGARHLERKLGVTLWQLAPNHKQDLDRLEGFLRLLKKTGTRQAFEFRHQSWFNKATYDLLEKYKACLCIAESGGRYPCVRERTANFLYIRFHGKGYSSDYPEEELKEWAEFIQRSRKEAFIYFNNDANGYAVKNALTLKTFLNQKTKPLSIS